MELEAVCSPAVAAANSRRCGHRPPPSGARAFGAVVSAESSSRRQRRTGRPRCRLTPRHAGNRRCSAQHQRASPRSYQVDRGSEPEKSGALGLKRIECVCAVASQEAAMNVCPAAFLRRRPQVLQPSASGNPAARSRTRLPPVRRCFGAAEDGATLPAALQPVSATARRRRLPSAGRGRRAVGLHDACPGQHGRRQVDGTARPSAAAQLRALSSVPSGLAVIAPAQGPPTLRSRPAALPPV